MRPSRLWNVSRPVRNYQAVKRVKFGGRGFFSAEAEAKKLAQD